MKPPVEAPMSMQHQPAGWMAKESSAAASFTPPRDAKGCGGPRTSTRAWSGIRIPDFSARRPSTRTRPASTSACAWAREGASPRSAST